MSSVARQAVLEKRGAVDDEQLLIGGEPAGSTRPMRRGLTFKLGTDVSQLVEEEERRRKREQEQLRSSVDEEPSSSSEEIAAEAEAVSKAPWRWQDQLPFSPRVRGLVLLNILVALVASNWCIVKMGGDTLDPFAFASLRFGVAALAFAPFLPKALKEPALVKAGVELGLWSAAGYLTQSLGLMYTDASRASFLSAFTVIIVPVIAGFAGKGVKPYVWAAVATSVVGVGLLEQTGAEFGPGDIWSFLSAVFFGIQVFRTEIVSRKMPEGQTLPLMSVVMAVIFASASALAIGMHPDAIAGAIADPAGARDALAAAPWGLIIYTGLLSTDFALVCEFEALQTVSSVEAALVYALEPVLGAGLAGVVLGERWEAIGWVGAALIVGSSVATQIYGSDEGDAVKAD